ncbi:DNA polymerase III subunit beta [Paenibacillus sp. J2TS4]|uniref:DNA polymerase III subunit beta n=1 Tax=Paenibacillus sp. J2TS4 TaxID=2807194 RepID=UPI001B0EEC0A|nr:DNA polymerase III subunit beta [Paenibacillus sp. J2TS4]GIP36030.1 DNA polymerase III subunit beta [Paenibacillus sp. J2TS4]
MKLTILRDQLNESIQHVSKAISSRTTIPILSGIKIDATPKGVTFTASDTDISIQSFVPLEEDDIQIVDLINTGSIVLPAKFFIEMVRKLPSDQIEIEAGEHHQTTIRSGTAEVQLVGFDPEEYPLLPRIDEHKVISMASDLLKSMIRQTSFAVSTSETTPVLTGVLWSLTENNLKLTGCDRHRLATRETRMETPPEQQFQNVVISGKTLSELNKILPDQSTLVDIVISETQVLFKLNHVLFYTRVLEGAYPDTSKLIPQQFQTQMTIRAKSLMDAIDRAYLLSREDKTNIVKVVMNEDSTIEVSSSSSELGKVKESLPISNHSGDYLKISFNSKYMLDALKVIDCENVCIGFTGPMNPIVIQPEDGTKILQLILPYRTTN